MCGRGVQGRIKGCICGVGAEVSLDVEMDVLCLTKLFISHVIERW